MNRREELLCAAALCLILAALLVATMMREAGANQPSSASPTVSTSNTTKLDTVVWQDHGTELWRVVDIGRGTWSAELGPECYAAFPAALSPAFLVHCDGANP